MLSGKLRIRSKQCYDVECTRSHNFYAKNESSKLNVNDMNENVMLL